MNPESVTRQLLGPGADPADQREWILRSALRAVAAEGRSAVTVARLIRESGVSRTAYYATFEDITECLDAAQQHGRARIDGALAAGWRRGRGEPWPDRVTGTVAGLITLFEEDPALAPAVLIELDHHSPATKARADESRARLASMLAESARAAEDVPDSIPEDLAPSLSRLAVGAAGEVLVTRVKEKPGEIRSAMPDVVGALLAPFLGSFSASHIWT